MFYSKHKLSVAVDLSISALISGLHKMRQTLYMPFYFRFRYSRGSPYLLLGVIIFYGIINLWSLNSLVNTN